MRSRNLIVPDRRKFGESHHTGSFGDLLVQQVEHRSRQAVNNARAIIQDASTSSSVKAPLVGVENAARFVIKRIRKKGLKNTTNRVALAASLIGLVAYGLWRFKFRR